MICSLLDILSLGLHGCQPLCFSSALAKLSKGSHISALACISSSPSCRLWNRQAALMISPERDYSRLISITGTLRRGQVSTYTSFGMDWMSQCPTFTNTAEIRRFVRVSTSLRQPLLKAELIQAIGSNTSTPG